MLLLFWVVVWILCIAWISLYCLIYLQLLYILWLTLNKVLKIKGWTSELKILNTIWISNTTFFTYHIVYILYLLVLRFLKGYELIKSGLQLFENLIFSWFGLYFFCMIVLNCFDSIFQILWVMVSWGKQCPIFIGPYFYPKNLCT